VELKTNTEITRAIHALTTELHRRLLEGARSQDTPALRGLGSDREDDPAQRAVHEHALARPRDDP
jgi:hypothetical protein